jgi:DNA polymerase I-like protein with 3'-5' exonuclease and polymerase domains
MSQDKNMLKIYGDSGESHDVYLFVAAFFEAHKNRVLEHYSLNGNGSKENLELIKGILKPERKDTKAPYLGWCYGLGANTLAFDKQISVEEARSTLRSIDTAFPGKQRLHNFLVKEWRANRGWVLNVRGRPITVHKDKLHDIVNRVTQSGGHDLLMRLLFHKWNYIKEHKVDARPYIVEVHDESVFLCNNEDLERFKEAVQFAFDKLNEELGWNVKLKHGGITVGDTCEIRCD